MIERKAVRVRVNVWTSSFGELGEWMNEWNWNNDWGVLNDGMDETIVEICVGLLITSIHEDTHKPIQPLRFNIH